MSFKWYAFYPFLILFACNPPTPDCIDQQQAFQKQFEPSNSEYQNAVLDILQHKTPEDFAYVFETFTEGEPTYMMTSFRNEEYCFSVKVLVNNWNKLAGMRRTNGYSYPKTLVNLKWEIKEIQGTPTVVYKDMRRIID